MITIIQHQLGSRLTFHHLVRYLTPIQSRNTSGIRSTKHEVELTVIIIEESKQQIEQQIEQQPISPTRLQSHPTTNSINPTPRYREKIMRNGVGFETFYLREF